MTREINFRGKRVDDGELVFGFIFMQNGKTWIIDYTWTEGTIFKDGVCLDGERLFSYIEVIPETVGQFTGLFDKNGEGVYEGDILRNDDMGSVSVVEWDAGAFIVKYVSADVYRLVTSLQNLSVVIGNIHENPELLEATK